MDSAKRAPIRKQSYQAPSISNRSNNVPKEYQTFKKAPKGKGSFLWFLFLLFAATVAGFWFWAQQSQETINNSIELVVDGPSEIISGDQATYKVSYKNIDTVALQGLELSVRWPNGFYFDGASIEPIDQNATTWLLEDIAPGQTVDLEITGQLVGQKDENLSAAFTLAYQPVNFHSDFKAKANIDTKISDAKLELSVEALDKTLVASQQEIKVNFKNLTAANLENLYIDILYPDDFEIAPVIDESSAEDVEVTEEENTELNSDFIIEGDYFKLNLAEEELKTMLINGFFTVDSKTDQLLVVEIGNMVDGNFRRLARIEKPMIVINPKFDMNFQINGQSSPQAVNWGDTLRYQLEVTNNSQGDVVDVGVSALIDSVALDWDSLETIGNYADNKITWTKTENEALGNWPAGETRIFTWQVAVVKEPIADRMVENIIEINIEGLGDWKQVSSPIAITIGESINFNNGVYWDLGGRRVGSGLLPPRVGEATEYLVIWSLPQATGVFDNVSVSTTLPPQVDFISEIDIQDGDLEFDLEDRSLTWNINSFSNIILPTTASFTLRLTPTKEDLGQATNILNTTTVNASGIEDVIVRSKAIKTADVISDSSSPIGIVE
ncbi:MAG: hypothetical protein WCS88_00925 [Patescibacteria group bacterium]